MNIKTAGELKAFLADVPDDTELLVLDEDGYPINDVYFGDLGPEDIMYSFPGKVKWAREPKRITRLFTIELP